MGRLRYNKNAINILKNSSYYYEPLFDNENIFFNNQNPLYIEIGMGKGNFIINNALKFNNINYIGIEKYPTVLAKAINKLKTIKINNLKFICTDALLLNKIFTPHSVDKIFLNFSDPWPKERHAKRRLTSSVFLNIYKKILKANKVVEFKTDNDKLYEWSLFSLKNNPEIEILYYHNDIYSDINNKYNLNNIQTEYEQKFILQNIKIKKIIFRFKNE